MLILLILNKILFSRNVMNVKQRIYSNSSKIIIVYVDAKKACCRSALYRSVLTSRVKANFHSGKLSVDWNGQETFSLSCELWVGTKKIFLCVKGIRFQSTDNFPEWKLAFIDSDSSRYLTQLGLDLLTTAVNDPKQLSYTTSTE
jgi:hypothetical protein